jgi:hypothetical protein
VIYVWVYEEGETDPLVGLLLPHVPRIGEHLLLSEGATEKYIVKTVLWNLDADSPDPKPYVDIYVSEGG